MELSNLPPVSLPMPWHERSWGLLQERLASNQLPHALLLAGTQHTGKAQFALALSRFLLCAKPDGPHNCGECHACELSGSGSHGDFLWVQPEESSKVIKIEQIRNVLRFSNKTAGFGACKVIAFAPADAMNLNAYNALLKLLEEPATDTYLILVCHRLYGVPPTIRSRCQIVRLATPEPDACLVWLDKITSCREESKKLFSLAGGLPQMAKQLYCAGGGAELEAASQSLGALMMGEASVPAVAPLWSDVDLGVFLEQLARELHRQLESLSSPQLRTRRGKGIFRLIDETIRLQRAVNSGANPGRQLSVEALLVHVRRELGSGLLGDKLC